MKVKVTIGLLLIVAMILPGLSVFGQDSTEMRIIWWGSQSRHDRTIEVIEMYEGLNPDLDIVFEFAGWGDYWTVINTQAAGGELPCIIQQDYRFLTEWQSRDLIVPLDEFIESGVIDTTDIPESNLTAGRIDGDLYGFNLGNNSQTIILDVDRFEEAGVDLPPDNWTWTDFEEISQAIYEGTGVWSIGPTLDEIALWAALYIGQGEWVYSEDGTAIGYEDDQPFIDYLNMIMRLQETGAYASPAEAGEYVDVGPEGTPIVAGDAAMDYRWSNQVIAVTSASGDDRNFALAELPRPDGGQSQNYLKPSMFWSITSQCENPEEAAAFINYFVNDLDANDVLFAERGVPVSTAVLEHLTPQLSALEAEMFAFVASMAEEGSPVPPADPAGAGAFLNDVYRPLVIDPILFGQVTPEEGMAILRAEGGAVLAAANE
jgi:multiple sugar transport system substrate-binding protein